MTDLKNSTADVSALISQTMNNEIAAGNRQATLALYLYTNEVTYSTDEMVKFFKTKGADRTTAIDDILVDLSDAYKDAVEMVAVFASRKGKKEALSTNEALQRESLNKRIRAAQNLFTRAMRVCFHLRVSGARRVAQSKGNITFYTPIKDEKGVITSDFEKHIASGNSLESAGAKDIEKIVPANGRSKAGTKAPAQVTAAIKDAASAINLRLKVAREANKGKATAITDLPDDDEAALEATLKELFVLKFADDKGKINIDDVRAYVAETFNPIKVDKSQPKAA